MPTSRSRIALFIALLVLGSLSWTMRELDNRRVTLVRNSGWVTLDPDSLYQIRRVDRALTEGELAGSDDYLNHPEGSPIPWPPYYPRMLAAALGPFAPQDEAERRPWVEMHVASAPRIFGVLTTLLAAFAGWRIAGSLGAFLAGGYHAVCAASVAYSKSGNGDFHAWVSLLFAAILVLLALGIEGRALERRSAGWRTGIAAGAVAGLLLGSWVGALLQLVAVDLIFAWLLFLHVREPRPGLAPMGLAFHLTAATVVSPAVLASPWNAVNPWMVVNLTWFHLLFLLAGAAVFVPLFFLRADGAGFRRYPWLVGAVLVLVFALSALIDSPLRRGVNEGFSWVSRVDSFMARVHESRPLVGPGRYGELFSFLGFGVLLLPFAWLALTRDALRGRIELIPWAVCVPFLAVQAARQGRFADVLVLPLGVTLAFGASRLLKGGRATASSYAPFSAAVGLAIALPLNWSSTTKAWQRHREGAAPAVYRETPASVGARGAADWLLAGRPNNDGAGVLAPWSRGHMLEWAADRPSVATNFGSYVGEESFAYPCRFFMTEDHEQARALLDRRRIGWVLVPSDLPNMLDLMIEVATPELRSLYAGPTRPDGSASVAPAWFRTFGARLMFDGEVVYPMGPPADAGPWQPIDFLRLVYVSPVRDPKRELRSPADLSPAAWLWEYVPGAVLEARGAPGTRLEVELTVRFPQAKRRLTWSSAAIAGGDGIARLTVPYATQEPNGDGWVSPDAARWSFGRAAGDLSIPEAAVTGGGTLLLTR